MVQGAELLLSQADDFAVLFSRRQAQRIAQFGRLPKNAHEFLRDNLAILEPPHSPCSV